MGVAESWVEAKMSWVEVGGGGWRQMELGGGGWSWVEVGARFSNTHNLFNLRDIPSGGKFKVFHSQPKTFVLNHKAQKLIPIKNLNLKFLDFQKNFNQYNYSATDK